MKQEGEKIACDQMVAGFEFHMEEFECSLQGNGEPDVIRCILQRLLYLGWTLEEDLTGSSSHIPEYT